MESPSPSPSPAPAAGRSRAGLLLAAAAAVGVVGVAILIGRTAPPSGPVAASSPIRPGWLEQREVVTQPERWIVVGRAVGADEKQAAERADAAALDELMWRLSREIANAPYQQFQPTWFRGRREYAEQMIANSKEANEPEDLAKWERHMIDSRRQVAEAAKQGGLLPAGRLELYWERTSTTEGAVLTAWVRWEVPVAALRQLTDRILVRREILGGEVMNLSPLLGWRLDRVAGAIVVALPVESPLAKAGLQEGDLVLTVGGQPVADAPDVERRITEVRRALGDSAGDFALQVRRLGSVVATLDLKVALARGLSEEEAEEREAEARAKGGVPAK